jgi:molybdopterin-containing oxidoreductase family membrane subunit
MALVVSYSYLNEYFMTWYSQDTVELVNLRYKALGPFAPYFWVMTFCNMIVPLSLFWRSIRRNLKWLWVISILINIGMWMERFVIIVGSLARDYLPYAWKEGAYRMTWVEAGITLGSLGWFLFFFLLFTKLLPVLPIAEVKRDILLEEREEEAIHAARHAAVGGASGSSGAREVVE